MNLGIYLSMKNETPSSFARTLLALDGIRTSRQLIAQWLDRTHTPSRTNMPRVFRATGGMVQPNDFYPELFEQ